MVNLHLVECLSSVLSPQDVLGYSICLWPQGSRGSCCSICFLKLQTMNFTNHLYVPSSSGRCVLCVCVAGAGGHFNSELSPKRPLTSPILLTPEGCGCRTGPDPCVLELLCCFMIYEYRVWT